jgi:hypothetical protein
MYHVDLLAYLRRAYTCMHAHRGIFRSPEILFLDLCDLTSLVPITWCYGWGFGVFFCSWSGTLVRPYLALGSSWSQGFLTLGANEVPISVNQHPWMERPYTYVRICTLARKFLSYQKQKMNSSVFVLDS